MPEAREPENFYLKWLWRTFTGPWGVAGLAGSIVSLVVPAVTRIVPDLRDAGVEMNDLTWIVPLSIFGGLALVRFIIAPWSIWRDERDRAEAAADKLSARIEVLRDHPLRLDRFMKDSGETDWHRVVVRNNGIERITDAKVYLQRFGSIERLIDTIPMNSDGSQPVTLDHDIPRAFDLFVYDVANDTIQISGRGHPPIVFSRSLCRSSFDVIFSVSGGGPTVHYWSQVMALRGHVSVAAPVAIANPQFRSDGDAYSLEPKMSLVSTDDEAGSQATERPLVVAIFDFDGYVLDGCYEPITLRNESGVPAQRVRIGDISRGEGEPVTFPLVSHIKAFGECEVWPEIANAPTKDGRVDFAHFMNAAQIGAASAARHEGGKEAIEKTFKDGTALPFDITYRDLAGKEWRTRSQVKIGGEWGNGRIVMETLRFD